MEKEIVLKLENLMGIGYWKFDGLPDQIVKPLDDLVDKFGSENILSGIRSLIPKFEKEEIASSECKGNSGIAGEMHMAAAMKLKYLNESIDHILSKNDKNT
ncbi:MAG: hypothetical protein H6999_04995 [Hahellaceae bacterium]|nr:hypothetical protein [Hahellaceae bacterium]MCP5169095.1 hypothetical protein [Hahellaceae bacterium]